MKNIALIELLCQCSDDKAEAEKLLLVAKIVDSSEYRSIMNSNALSDPFEKYYTFDKLDVLDKEDLEQRIDSLHLLALLRTKLVNSIKFGNACKLNKNDYPDFLSLDSLSKLIDKLNDSSEQTNYSNISNSEALAVFSDTTIKSARECLERLPLSIAQKEYISEEDISNAMGKVLYCVNIDEFNKVHLEFCDYSYNGKLLIEKESFRNKRHLILKIVVIILCFGGIFVSSQFDIMSESYTSMFVKVMSVASLIYLLWG